MPDHILISSDKAIYEPIFGTAIVTVKPGTLTGSGGSYKILGKTVCVDGDESSAKVPGCSYTAGSFTIPGMGNVSIDQLNPDQLTTSIQLNGKAVMLKGSKYIAKFEVTMPAQMPTLSGPVPDPVAKYIGKGTFINSNTTMRMGRS